MSDRGNEGSRSIESLQFRVFNKTMETISVGYGVFLIIWGITVSLLSHSQSLTSLIPTIFGFFLTLFAILALKVPKKRMLFMHCVVVISVVIVLGGADFFRSLFNGVNPFTNAWVGSSKLIMFLTGVIFIFTCIKSFLFARRLKSKTDIIRS